MKQPANQPAMGSCTHSHNKIDVNMKRNFIFITSYSCDMTIHDPMAQKSVRAQKSVTVVINVTYS